MALGYGFRLECSLFELIVIVYSFSPFDFILPRVTEEGLIATVKNLADEKPTEEDVVDGNKENPAVDIEEKEPEDKVNLQILVFHFPMIYFLSSKFTLYDIINGQKRYIFFLGRDMKVFQFITHSSKREKFLLDKPI